MARTKLDRLKPRLIHSALSCAQKNKRLESSTLDQWVALSYGALDVSGISDFGTTEVLVTPTLPSMPLALSNLGADLYRRLVNGPVPSSAFTQEELVVIHEMAAVGLASSNHMHDARQTSLPKPWMFSPQHELVYAIVANVAREQQIDLVFVKGPILHPQGVRDREHSGDVDPLVRSEHVDLLSEALIPWGWSPKPYLWEGTEVAHSRTLVPNESWGCEIDVHRRMYGSALSDEDAFSVIMQHTESAEFAGNPALVPQNYAGAVLASLRAMVAFPGKALPPSAKSLAVETLRRGGEHAPDFASELDVLIALKDALQEAFPERKIDFSNAGQPRDWVNRAQANSTRYYLASLKDIPFSKRPAALWKAIWPTSELSLISEQLSGGSTQNVTLARPRRLGRGLVGLFRS